MPKFDLTARIDMHSFNISTEIEADTLDEATDLFDRQLGSGFFDDEIVGITRHQSFDSEIFDEED